MNTRSSIPMGSFLGRLSSRRGPKITTSISNGPASGAGQYSAAEESELSDIKLSLQKLLIIEKQHYDQLGDKILKTVRETERQKLKSKEEEAEAKKPKSKDDAKRNPVVRGALNGLDGIINFFGNLLKWFVGYKIIEWVSKEENLKKVQNFSKLFLGIIKFVSTVVGFGVDKLISGIDKLVNGDGISKAFGLLEAVVGFFTLKWLANPLKIISDIKGIAGLFTKTIPNTINGIVNFFTNLIPTAATQAVDTAVKEGFKGADAWAKNFPKEAAAEAAKQATSQAAESGTKTAGKVAGKGVAKVTGKSLLKKLPVIGAVASSVFALDRASKGDWLGAGMELASGGASLIPGFGTAASIGIDAALIGRDIHKANTEKNIPKLAKGGIVTKPTKALVGEAGPEAILPLDKLSSFSSKGFTGDVNKVIPDFMKLLTYPFKIVGAGIIALVSSSLSMIPGVGPFIAPLLSNVASMFGVPKTLMQSLNKAKGAVTTTLKDAGGSIAKLFGEKPVTISKGRSFTSSGDTSVRGLLGNILGALVSKNSGNLSESTVPPPASSGGPPAGSPSGSGGGPDGAPTVDTAKQSIQAAGGLREDGSLKGVQGNTKVVANTRGGGTIEQHSPGGGLKPVINGDRKYWYNASGDVFKWEKPGDPLTDITSNRLFDSKTLGGPLVRIPSSGEVKILKGMFGADQTSIGMYNYEIGKILKKRGEKHPRTNAKISPDIWESPVDGKYGKPAKFILGGGKVPGPGVGDIFPALLEPEEYVLNRNAVKAMGGPKVLDKINFGMFPRFSQFNDGIIKMATGGTVIQYITGDKSHPAYASDHGGKKYHDHLAFKTKAERDAAIKYLESKGWFVGSKNDGKHASGSYHYSNQAFDIPFYPNQSKKRVTDDQAGETKLSSMLRADLAAGGFNVPGNIGPGGPRENDKTSPSGEGELLDGNKIASMLGQLYTGLTKKVPDGPSPTQPPAPPTPSPSKSSQALSSAQRTNNNVMSSIYSRPASKGNVINLNDPDKVISQTSTQPLLPSLGNTLPDTPLTLFPLNP